MFADWETYQMKSIFIRVERVLRNIQKILLSKHFKKNRHLHAMYLCSVPSWGISKIFVKNKGFVPVSNESGIEWLPKRQAQYTKKKVKILADLYYFSLFQYFNIKFQYFEWSILSIKIWWCGNWTEVIVLCFCRSLC